MTGFGDIIGHEQIIEHFRSALKNHQVSHAYILNGENGSGICWRKLLRRRWCVRQDMVIHVICVGRAISLTAAITRM